MSTTDRDLAKDVGVHHTTITRWRQDGADLPSRIAAHLEENRLRAHAKTIGLSAQRIYQRVLAGWTLERACTTPPQPVGRPRRSK